MTLAGEQSPPVPGGLAAERTSLAWTRSAFAIVAIAAAVAKAGEQANQPAIAGVAVLVLVVLAALVWWAGRHEHVRRTSGEPADPLPSRRLMLLLSAASVISAVAAFTIALLT